eukprot:1156737-Pelagomonas_calceolata.AAC.6
MGNEPHLRVPSEVSLCATLTMAELGTASGDVAVTVGDSTSGEVRKMTFSATAVSQVRACWVVEGQIYPFYVTLVWITVWLYGCNIMLVHLCCLKCRSWKSWAPQHMQKPCLHSFAGVMCRPKRCWTPQQMHTTSTPVLLPHVQTFEMLDSTSGALVKEVDFGPHYFGEVLHRSIVIFNNGPIDVKYLITYVWWKKCVCLEAVCLEALSMITQAQQCQCTLLFLPPGMR